MFLTYYGNPEVADSDTVLSFTLGPLQLKEIIWIAFKMVPNPGDACVLAREVDLQSRITIAPFS